MPNYKCPFCLYRIDPETSQLELFSSVDLLDQSPIPPEVWHYPFQVPTLMRLIGSWTHRLPGS
jgi:hypothetical protein